MKEYSVPAFNVTTGLIETKSLKKYFLKFTFVMKKLMNIYPFYF